jgi:hypothetical protein
VGFAFSRHFLWCGKESGQRNRFSGIVPKVIGRRNAIGLSQKVWQV